MTLQTRITDFITSVGTDYKQLRTWLTGSASGNLNSLTTTDKSSIIAAINEAKNSGASPGSASESSAGIAEIATLAEVATGTAHDNKFVTPAGVRQERNALKSELLGGVEAAYDTLSELLAVAQGAEETADITALIAVVGNKANSSDVYTKTEIGNPETDLVALYTAAKA